jgi:hypothetical protein
MGAYKARATGVTVKVLDLSELHDMALERFQQNKPDMKKIRTERLGLIANDFDGRYYVISDEGVGGEITDTEPYAIELWDNTDYGTGTFDWLSMMPIGSYKLRLTDALELPGETVDLSQFVRSFGARLEGNFWLWYETVTKKVDA